MKNIKKTIYIIIIFSILYIVYKNYKIKHDNYDIVIAPGGVLGFYTLGICHYIKNNYNIKNKKMIGFSAGSFNVVFMSIDPKYDNDFLLNLFKLNIRGDDNPRQTIKKITSNIKNTIDFKDIDLRDKCIGLTTPYLSLKTINTFRSNNEIINSCISSSFIPYITYNDIFYFYKGNIYYDGGIMYHFLKRTLNKDCLAISYYMFNRNTTFSLFNILHKSNISIYELYILGYHDAIKNKAYFDKFFNHSLSYTS